MYGSAEASTSQVAAATGAATTTEAMTATAVRE